MARRKARRKDARRVADAASGWSPMQRIALAAVFLVIAVLSTREVGSLDAGFHLKAGEHVLAHGWPDTDPFTYTVNDRPYIDTSWGYQVLLAALHKSAGAPAIVLFHTTLVLLIFGLVYLSVRRLTRDAVATILVLFLGALAAEMRFETRPELVSYALLALTLCVLGRYDEEPDARRQRVYLWLLPAIQLTWVNVHGLFVLGWVALACFNAGRLLRDRRVDLALAGWSGIAAAITLINPYGWKALLLAIELTTRFGGGNPFKQNIAEFSSTFLVGRSESMPFYPRVPFNAFWILAVLVVLSIVPLWRRRRYPALLLVSFLIPATMMVRNMPLMVVACSPGAALALSGLLRRVRPTFGGKVAVRAGRIVSVAVLVCALALALRVTSGAYYVATRRHDRFGWGFNELTQPLAAAAYADRVGLPGGMLNHLNFGGYLMWARDEPVFIDGRLEVMGERFYREYREVLSSDEALAAAVGRHGIRWMIFPYKTNGRLLGRMSKNRAWRLAYFDELAAVFVLDGPDARWWVGDEIQALRRSPTPVRVHELPGLGGGPRRRGLAYWVRGLVHESPFPHEPFSKGLFHYFRGEMAQSASYFAEAIRDSQGAFYECYANLGHALFRQGRFDEAAACYEIVLQEAPDNQRARDRLAEIASFRSRN